jgi:hypothetical protein
MLKVKLLLTGKSFTERVESRISCCQFLDFSLSIGGDKAAIRFSKPIFFLSATPLRMLI